jgi:hypothetical protein
MRSAQECAEAARRLIRAAHWEQDPKVRKRLLELAKANHALVRLANHLAKKSQQSEHRKESMRIEKESTSTTLIRHDRHEPVEVEDIPPLQDIAPIAEEPELPASVPPFYKETLEAIRTNAQEARRCNAQTITELEAWRAEIDAVIAFLKAK